MIRAVLFDLDGTLADTALDLCFALNKMLSKRNLPNVTIHDVRNIANQGVRGLLNLGFSIKDNDKGFDDLKQEYLQEYKKCFFQHSVLFKDIDKLIVKIHELKLKWGIVTNKSKIFSDRLVKELKFSISPIVVVSGDTTSEAKPSTKPMLYATNRINIDPVDCIYVGDSKIDIEAGKNSGMKTVLARWRYIFKDNIINNSWGEDYIIYEPLELLYIINELNNNNS